MDREFPSVPESVIRQLQYKSLKNSQPVPEDFRRGKGTSEAARCGLRYRHIFSFPRAAAAFQGCLIRLPVALPEPQPIFQKRCQLTLRFRGNIRIVPEAPILMAKNRAAATTISLLVRFSIFPASEKDRATKD